MPVKNSGKESRSTYEMSSKANQSAAEEGIATFCESSNTLLAGSAIGIFVEFKFIYLISSSIFLEMGAFSFLTIG